VAERAGRLALIWLLLTGLAMACQGTARDEAAHSRTPAPTPARTTSALPDPSQRCGLPGPNAKAVWFEATDGTLLDGAFVGSGSAGVVLAHEYPAELCGWWPFATYLARRGFLVLAFDFRCFGLSTCPDDATGDLTDDVRGAEAELRRAGATSVALAGASLGGTVTLMAASSMDPPPDAVVCLSGEPDLGYLVGSTKLDAQSAVPRMTSPSLFVLAREDRNVSVQDMRGLYRAAGSKDKRLVVLPASFGHGWNIVSTVSGGITSAARTVLDFLRAHR
jgi:alpha-beta hydrolase superfamily lysophospholipase